MKRIAVFLVLFLTVSQTSWAARAKVSSIARDPYISALVIDADTGQILFSENPDTPVYPASVVKLMDLLIILERIAQGKNTLTEMVQVTTEAAKTGGSQVYLDPKEQFSIEDLLYALSVQSANDAAVALAIHVAGSKDGFVAMMNEKAAQLGMKNTHFYSVHGLPPSEGQKTDQTTASDLALLCRALVSLPDALKYTSTRERGFRDNKFIMRNHNHLLGQVEGCDGLKTGYFEAAGFSIAATAKRGGVRVIAIVMGSKDRKVRDAKTTELLAKGFALLPPKPETAKPEPAVAVTTPATQENETEAAGQPAAAMAQEKELPSAGHDSWKPFLLGMAAGIVLSAVLAFFVARKRSMSGRR